MLWARPGSFLCAHCELIIICVIFTMVTFAVLLTLSLVTFDLHMTVLAMIPAQYLLRVPVLFFLIFLLRFCHKSFSFGGLAARFEVSWEPYPSNNRIDIGCHVRSSFVSSADTTALKGDSHSSERTEETSLSITSHRPGHPWKPPEQSVTLIYQCTPSLVGRYISAAPRSNARSTCWT